MGHDTPQLPQWAELVVRLAQTAYALQYVSVDAAQPQTPALQDCPDGHLTPHPPQL